MEHCAIIMLHRLLSHSIFGLETESETSRGCREWRGVMPVIVRCAFVCFAKAIRLSDLCQILWRGSLGLSCHMSTGLARSLDLSLLRSQPPPTILANAWTSSCFVLGTSASYQQGAFRSPPQQSLARQSLGTNRHPDWQHPTFPDLAAGAARYGEIRTRVRRRLRQRSPASA